MTDSCEACGWIAAVLAMLPIDALPLPATNHGAKNYTLPGTYASITVRVLQQCFYIKPVPKDRVILIYCDGGECELSHHVADVLKRFAYGPIFIYTGGWAEWTTKK